MKGWKNWALLGIVSVTAGCANAGKLKGKTMENQIENLLSAYQDLYFDSNENRKLELEDKVSELEWEGEFIGAPDKVDGTTSGIPILAISKRSDLREWEVEERSNCYVISFNGTQGTTWLRRLYPLPTKRMKPQPKVKGRKPESGEGYMTGVVRHVVGESLPEPLLPGEYFVALVTWDQSSGPRRIIKQGIDKHSELKSQISVEWPWNKWKESQLFQKKIESPEIKMGLSCALKLVREKSDIKLMASVSTKVRHVHQIHPNPKRHSDPNIRAGIKVDLILMTLDKAPQMVSIAVPIFGSSPLHLGDSINGWFNLPFPFEPSTEDQMLYAVVDGTLTGPYKVTGTNHN